MLPNGTSEWTPSSGAMNVPLSMRGVATMCALALTMSTVWGSVDGLAQNARKPAFEVASIREVPSVGATRGRAPISERVTEGRLDITNAPLRVLLWMAFGVKDSQLSAPAWLKTGFVDQRRFDIHATIPAGATRDQLPDMLQRLLIERFGLTAHVEAPLTSVYELVVSKGGIKMHEAAPANELEKVFPTASGETVISDSTGSPLSGSSLVADAQHRIIATTNGTRLVTASLSYETKVIEPGKWRFDADRMTMKELAAILEDRADRPVVDKTGLQGVYQFTIELPPSNGTLRAMQGAGITTTRDGAPIDVNPSGVSIFKAVDSLGLELTSGRASIDIVVIDTIQQTPTPN